MNGSNHPKSILKVQLRPEFSRANQLVLHYKINKTLRFMLWMVKPYCLRAQIHTQIQNLRSFQGHEKTHRKGHLSNIESPIIESAIPRNILTFLILLNSFPPSVIYRETLRPNAFILIGLLACVVGFIIIPCEYYW